MEGRSDFIQWLGHDMSMKILMCLEDPSDLVRASAVSSLWRLFVISNGLCKQLCLRIFPEISSICDAIEVNNLLEPMESSPENLVEYSSMHRDHRVYAFLAQGLTSYIRKDCISEAISASSTDNYPDESIQNTLELGDRVDHRASYWSSEGESDPTIPEILLYKLVSNLCVISEIHIQPFQAYFQFGSPIYSAQAVRFRMGRTKFPVEKEEEADRNWSPYVQEMAEDMFVWTYISPEFPMAQVNFLQPFRLPEPVLCIGGILQIELLGRHQRQEMDGLYYICVSHVQVVGRPLMPEFDAEIHGPSGYCTLKYHPEAASNLPPAEPPAEDAVSSSRFSSFTASVRGWEQMILNTLLGAGAVVADNDDVSDDELHI